MKWKLFEMEYKWGMANGGRLRIMVYGLRIILRNDCGIMWIDHKSFIEKQNGSFHPKS